MLTMVGVIGGFVASLVGLAWTLRRREADGSFDVPSSTVSRPGLRRLFDFGPGGWSSDGRNQAPRTS